MELKGEEFLEFVPSLAIVIILDGIERRNMPVNLSPSFLMDNP